MPTTLVTKNSYIDNNTDNNADNHAAADNNNVSSYYNDGHCNSDNSGNNADDADDADNIDDVDNNTDADTDPIFADIFFCRLNFRNFLNFERPIFFSEAF